MSANLFARKKHWLATYKGWKHFILAWGLFLVFVKMKHRNFLVILLFCKYVANSNAKCFGYFV